MDLLGLALVNIYAEPVQCQSGVFFLFLLLFFFLFAGNVSLLLIDSRVNANEGLFAFREQAFSMVRFFGEGGNCSGFLGESGHFPPVVPV
jgi:hypothetical protein